VRGARNVKSQVDDRSRSVVILGAGPAGLSAAYELCNLGIPSVVLERDSVVGGLARTVEHNGFRFDIGGHRFYTKLSLVQQIWREVLSENLLTHTRMSRIYYKSKFFRYPLQPLDALCGLGVRESVRCAFSFIKSRTLPKFPEDDFETWVSNRFGRRLFDIFFKSYTEKVWGMDCRQISADWAAQRIQGLSLFSLLRDSIHPRNGKGPKTLIRSFQYPRLGPGMLWSRMREIIERKGAQVVLDAGVERICWKNGQVVSVDARGRKYEATHIVSSIPIRELIEKLDPVPPEALLLAAKEFKYRDFLTVALMVRARNLFPDHWIYLHDANVLAGRVQNYKNWSPDMTPSEEMTCLGVEYFCNDSDAIWNRPDADLIALAKREMANLGLAKEQHFVDGAVIRMLKAYPVYDRGYKHGLGVVRDFLATIPNLQLIGRNGMHRYNNQDHSMLTGILAARNVSGAHFDLWNLNVEKDYLEAGSELNNEELDALKDSQPLVPTMV
jgi:protoporphyrinogen oxidase